MTLEERLALGQRLAVGFDGLTVPEEYRALVRRHKVGNAILFRRNAASLQQLRALCAGLRELIEGETGHPPFIMIDEESGSVSRLAPIAGETPSAMAIGATGSEANAEAIGSLIGARLRAAGINLNMAPVLDCWSNPANSVCGNRMFSADPERVGAFGAAYIRGLHAHGILACGKHFPGHGDTDVDSHLDLPVIDKPAEAIRRTELVSFRRAMEKGLDSIMSAHIVLPAFEKEHIPATLSRAVMTGLVRDELGFEGLVLSDGMEMNGVTKLFPIPEGTRRALSAGVDICLICHSPADAAATCEHIAASAAEGRFDLNENRAHCQRILARKAGLWTEPGDPGDFTGPEQTALSRRIMAEAVRITHAPVGQPLLPLGPDTVCFGVPMQSTSFASDQVTYTAVDSLSEALHLRNGGLIPDEDKLRGAKNALVVLSRHADLPRVQEAALRLLEQGLPLIAVGLYTPACLAPLPDTAWKITAWQYDRLAVDAVIRLLKGEVECA